MSWRDEGGPSHWTSKHEGDLPCEWLSDNPLRSKSVEFLNHHKCTPPVIDVKCMYIDNRV